MKSFLTASAFAALFQGALAVAPGIAAPDTPVSGCATSYDGTFSIGIADANGSSKLKARSDEANAITLTMTLQNGVLTDSVGRTGYIASNRQFQFDYDNGQAGTIWNSGFSVCPNSTLALQSDIWWGCLSGTFRNLYDKSLGKQCIQMFLITEPVSGTGPIYSSTTVEGAGSGSSGSGSGSGSGTGQSSSLSPTSVLITKPHSTASISTMSPASLSNPHSSTTHIVVPPLNVTSTSKTSSPSSSVTSKTSSHSTTTPPSQSSPPPSSGNSASAIFGSSFLAIAAALSYAVLL